MTGHRCPLHHLPMVEVSQPAYARCTDCGFTSGEMHLEYCPKCGEAMQIVAPDALWRCPECAPRAVAATGRRG